MSGIAATLARLAGTSVEGDTRPVAPGRLSTLTGFGSNPGALIARTFVPAGLAAGAALVVVLHGCTQNASTYDRGAGWSELAAEAGFALLLPEQQRANNPSLCFNWYERGDVARGKGEVASIRQMVAAMVERYGLDSARIFVTGLSAGGAMTSGLLAAYPDVFAGGAIIAGLPFGAASGVSQALQRMRSAAPVATAGLRDAMIAAGGRPGALPIVSVWHGDADHVVHASNAAASVAQWRAIHGAAADPAEELIDGQRRRVWRDPPGRAVVESWTVAGMGHGTPLATSGPDACGAAGPHMLEAGISSTRHIARFWDLLPARDGSGGGRDPAVTDRPRVARVSTDPAAAARQVMPPSGAIDPGAVIENALRAAGLMK